MAAYQRAQEVTQARGEAWDNSKATTHCPKGQGPEEENMGALPGRGTTPELKGVPAPFGLLPSAEASAGVGGQCGLGWRAERAKGRAGIARRREVLSVPHSHPQPPTSRQLYKQSTQRAMEQSFSLLTCAGGAGWKLSQPPPPPGLDQFRCFCSVRLCALGSRGP